MKQKPPVPLMVAATLYLGYLIVLLLLDLNPVVAGRLAVSAALFFFVLRGSRLAGNILAVLCGLSGLVLLAAAGVTFSSNSLAAATFAFIAALLAVFAWYLFFSSSVRTFQGKAQSVASP